MSNCKRCGKKTMFLFLDIEGLCKRCAKQLRNEYLIEWQNFVVDVAECNKNRLVVPEEQLRQISRQQAENDLRIIMDSARLIESTFNPEVFFMRLDLMVERLEHLAVLEKYISFSDVLPSDALNQTREQYQTNIRGFIKRYYIDVAAKAETLKTEAAKVKRYNKFYASFDPYWDQLDDANKKYVEKVYRMLFRDIGLTPPEIPT